MKETCFCSVIVPVYNAESYLRRCIDSIVQQPPDLFELILVDDGSADSSGAICEEYAQRYDNIRVIRQENAGHTAARNAGLRCAKGEYVGFVDSDDWVDPQWLGDCHQAVLQGNSPDVILYGYRRVGENGPMGEKPQPYPPGCYDRAGVQAQFFPTLLTSGHFSLWERLMKRPLAQKHQFTISREILLGEDLICCVCTMFDAERVCVLPGIYYNYFQRAGSVAHSYHNYTFRNWELLQRHLTQVLSQSLPGFEGQLGYCSIRFLQRAVLGDIHRGGLKAVPEISRTLGREDLKQLLRRAEIPKGKRVPQFKRFCLKHRLVLTLWCSDAMLRLARRVKK